MQTVREEPTYIHSRKSTHQPLILASTPIPKDAYLMSGRQSSPGGAPVPLRPAGRQSLLGGGRKREDLTPLLPTTRKEGQPPATHLSDLLYALIWLQVTSRPRVGAED